MCLRVLSLHHPFGNPKTAKRDIHVYKVLMYWFTRYETPYKHLPVNFYYNTAILISPLDVPDVSDQVHKGIHAYRTLDRARSSGYQVFDAIIPKGSLYYIGFNQEIVSNKLIVFKTRTAYNILTT